MSKSGIVDNLITIIKIPYGAFGEWRNIEYPIGYNPSNSHIMISDIDFREEGPCLYTVSPDKLNFKGERINSSKKGSNIATMFFVKK